MKANRQERKRFAFLPFIPFFIIVASIFISIGYAAISITGEISGNLSATIQDGLFITDVSYASSVNANKKDSIINSYYESMLDSKIVLSNSNGNSSITYNVTVYNNSLTPLAYFDTTYGQDFYDNHNIIYTLDGIKKGDKINVKESRTFMVTFSYKDGRVATNNVLNSYLNFNFNTFYSVSYPNILPEDVITYGYPTVLFEGEKLRVNLGDTINRIYVDMGGVRLKKPKDFTFANGILELKIPITDNLIIRNHTIFEPVPVVENTEEFLDFTKLPPGAKILREDFIGNNALFTIGVPAGNSSASTYSFSFTFTNVFNKAFNNVKTNTTIDNPGGTSGNPAVISAKSSVDKIKIGKQGNGVFSIDINYKVTSNPKAETTSVLSFKAGQKIEEIYIYLNFEAI